MNCTFSRLFLLMLIKQICHSQKTNFAFTEYPYKETNKNEIIYQEYESACEQSPSCVNLKGLEHVRCVRECMSPTCYQQIYYTDPIEEGEIDVRLNSFKGCFIQRTGRMR